MMRWLIHILFIVIFTFNYILEITGISTKLLLILPELFSIYIGLYVLLLFAFKKNAKIQLRYLFFFCAFALHLAIGIIGNHVQPLAVIAGMRTYLKFLPLFFLPLLYAVSEPQLRSQLIVLTVLGIMQLPIATYQRFFQYANVFSGDLIAGTLTSAPSLTIYLVGVIAVMIGFYLKKRISTKTFVVLTAFMFIPTAINETKATVILLPFALIIPTLYEASKEKRIKILATVIPVGVLLILGFNYAYQTFYTEGGRLDAFAFFSSGRAETYLYRGAEASQVTGDSSLEVRRIDAIVLAYKENSKDFFRLVWGVGIGNAAVSFSRKFQGKYNSEFMRLGGKQNSISGFIWEIGLLGIVHVIWLLVLIYLDALNLRKRNDLIGSLALGWIGVTVVFLISLPYQNLITKSELIYPFSYLSGYLSAMSYNKQKNLSVE